MAMGYRSKPCTPKMFVGDSPALNGFAKNIDPTRHKVELLGYPVGYPHSEYID